MPVFMRLAALFLISISAVKGLLTLPASISVQSRWIYWEFRRPDSIIGNLSLVIFQAFDFVSVKLSINSWQTEGQRNSARKKEEEEDDKATNGRKKERHKEDSREIRIRQLGKQSDKEDQRQRDARVEREIKKERRLMEWKIIKNGEWPRRERGEEGKECSSKQVCE